MKYQRGASYSAVLIAVLGFCFLAKIVVAVWEPYWDNRVIEKEIETALQSAPKNMSPGTFSDKVNQSLSMNNIRGISFKDISRVTNTEGLQVKLDYEVRKNFVLNIDLVLKFEKSFDQRSVQNH